MINPPLHSDDRSARWFFRLLAALAGLVMLIPVWSLLPRLLHPHDPLFLTALSLSFAPAFFLWIGLTGQVFPQWRKIRRRPTPVPPDSADGGGEEDQEHSPQMNTDAHR